MWIRSQMDRALSWDTVKRIRDHWPRRLIIKGVLAVEDVEKAVEPGAVRSRCPIMAGGSSIGRWRRSMCCRRRVTSPATGSRSSSMGGRRGSDVLKAMALGADAVLIGRAALYGVAAAGRPGASRALAILREEIDRGLALLGSPSIKELGPRFLVRAS
jgi:(S)-mandelate dehydrogenase